MSNNILFVCSGNTCRSPMAAYIAAAVKEAQFPESDFCFDSAGIATSDGFPATDHAIEALSEWGIDMSGHRSKKFQPYMTCLLYTSPSPRDRTRSRMPSSA